MRRKLLGINIGTRYVRWVTLERPYRVGDKSAVVVLCKCDCGTRRIVSVGNLVSGTSGSCGCLSIEKTIARSTTHGHCGRETRTRLYNTWASMVERCSTPNQLNYKDYGGRGIKVCDEWKTYEPFMRWANASGYTDKLTIERMDANGNYCPENCTWIARNVQSRNRRDTKLLEAFGEVKGIADWADDKRCAVSLLTLRGRIGRGWNTEEAISSTLQTKWSRRGKNVRQKTACCRA